MTSAPSVCLWVQNGGKDVTQSESILSYEAKEKQEVWGCRGRIILSCLSVSLTSWTDHGSATGLGQPWYSYHDPHTSTPLASDLKDLQAVMWLNVGLSFWSSKLTFEACSKEYKAVKTVLIWQRNTTIHNCWTLGCFYYQTTNNHLCRWENIRSCLLKD